MKTSNNKAHGGFFVREKDGSEDNTTPFAHNDCQGKYPESLNFNEAMLANNYAMKFFCPDKDIIQLKGAHQNVLQKIIFFGVFSACDKLIDEV